MASEWEGVVATTADKHFRTVDDLTVRNRLLLAYLKKNGRITLNNDGFNLIWTVRNDQHAPEAIADGAPVNYARHNLWTKAELDVRMYFVGDVVSKKEKAMNSGMPAIVNRWSEVLKTLGSSIQDDFCKELYIDGYASGNENRICGFESCMGVSATAAATDLVANPSDTYATLSTALGQGSSTWDDALTTQPSATIATDWPHATGDAKYDYWSPRLVHANSTTWAGSSDFEDNAESCLRQAIQWMQHTTGQSADGVLGLMDGIHFTKFKNRESSKLRINTSNSSREAEELGFYNTFVFDGVTFHSEYGVPANRTYLIPTKRVELMSHQDRLFNPEGPFYDPDILGWKFNSTFIGNLKLSSPKYFTKIADLD